jgi:hypothetical protein
LCVFRNECILTIDPPTARDLDDALSCKKLDNGNFLVGVHIADVSYFLEEGTPLDQAVARKATSTYLVDSVSISSYKLEWFLTTTVLKNAVFWDVALYGFIINQCFGGTCRLHLQAKRNNASEEKC